MRILSQLLYCNDEMFTCSHIGIRRAMHIYDDVRWRNIVQLYWYMVGSLCGMPLWKLNGEWISIGVSRVPNVVVLTPLIRWAAQKERPSSRLYIFCYYYSFISLFLFEVLPVFMNWNASINIINIHGSMWIWLKKKVSHVFSLNAVSINAYSELSRS